MDDILLSVSAIHSERVQLQKFTAGVLVQSGPLNSRWRWELSCRSSR